MYRGHGAGVVAFGVSEPYFSHFRAVGGNPCRRPTMQGSQSVGRCCRQVLHTSSGASHEGTKNRPSVVYTGDDER